MKSNRYKILVVEDEPNINEFVCTLLEVGGYQVVSAMSGGSAMLLFNSHRPDLIILDLGLPDMDELNVLKHVRESSLTPIIVLSARGGEMDKVEALNMGANDYVTKPFHIEEVMARMQALMRRNSGLASQVISLPPFQVDLSRRELSINDEVIKLTAFEYTIMETLIRNNGKVVSKDSLMLQLYPDAELRESHTIDVLMGRLRKKIQAQYPQEVITTVRGQGYLFELR